MHAFIDLFLHLDTHLQTIIAQYGTMTYAILFLIIFCETGLVVTPFLPGDSLLFAAGTFAALGSFNIALLFLLLAIAAILGNMLNYAAGKWLGEKVFTEHAHILKKSYLIKTHAFYEKYGAKTIVISRFMPIVRTVAPFVAGAGTMRTSTFMFYNFIGGILWVALFLFCGFFFGNIPSVKHNFSLVILVIIGLSVLAPIIEWIRSRRHA